jgi:hypothetical protein
MVVGSKRSACVTRVPRRQRSCLWRPPHASLPLLSLLFTTCGPTYGTTGILISRCATPRSCSTEIWSRRLMHGDTPSLRGT